MKGGAGRSASHDAGRVLAGSRIRNLGGGGVVSAVVCEERSGIAWTGATRGQRIDLAVRQSPAPDGKGSEARMDRLCIRVPREHIHPAAECGGSLRV